MRKHYAIYTQAFRSKLRFRFLFSSPKTWRLHIKLLTRLLEFCSTQKDMLVTNARAKANTATKLLQKILITSTFYYRAGRNNRTLKGPVLWN